MTWVLVVLLAILSFAAVVFLFKVPKGGREAVAAALMLGIAGYALQGRPDLASAAKPGRDAQNPELGQFLVEARTNLRPEGIPTGNRWLIISDGLARNGRYIDAAQLLRGAIEDNPGDSEAWLALGNVLLAHADGALTPPALHAYRRAAKADPKAPGPHYFLGLALAQSGELTQARDMWADLLKKAPEKAPWRAPLAEQLRRLESFIAAQAGGAASPAGSPSDPSSRPPEAATSPGLRPKAVPSRP